MKLNTGEDIAEKTNVNYWKSNYFILRDTNLNSFALKLHNLYSTERNSKQSKINILRRYCRELNKLNIYIYILLYGIQKNAIQIFSEGINKIE